MSKINSDRIEMMETTPMTTPVMAYFDGGSHGNGTATACACGGWYVAPHPAVPALGHGVADGRCYTSGPDATNNIAEYNAAIDALRAVYRSGYRGPVRLHGDSELVVRQFNGEYRCKDPHLKDLLAHLRRACSYFDSVEMVSIPREDNAMADEQSRRAYACARQTQ